MLAGSLAMGIKPKTILDSYGTSGFDVMNVIKKLDKDEISKSGTILMNGSILAFPHSCFLWKMEDISEVTFESLAPVILHRPKVEYLFLGSDTPMQLDKMRHLKKSLREYNITFEQLDLVCGNNECVLGLENSSFSHMICYALHSTGQHHGHVQYFEWRRSCCSSCIDCAEGARGRG